jgi:hypothetical protein
MGSGIEGLARSGPLVEDLRKHWPAIEGAARLAEPEERRKRAENRKASPEHAGRRTEAAEHRRHRYPVPEDELPPLDLC